MSDPRIEEVMTGRTPGIHTYNTGPYGPDLINRSDIMRIMLAERVLRYLLDDDEVSIEVSDHQDVDWSGETQSDTLHVYVSYKGGQADHDIRRAVPEEVAVDLYRELLSLQRYERLTELVRKVGAMRNTRLPVEVPESYENERFIAVLRGQNRKHHVWFRPSPTQEDALAKFADGADLWVPWILVDLDTTEAFHVCARTGYDLVPFCGSIDLDRGEEE